MQSGLPRSTYKFSIDASNSKLIGSDSEDLSDLELKLFLVGANSVDLDRGSYERFNYTKRIDHATIHEGIVVRNLMYSRLR